jgi:SAM-dependent methyltransferase
MIRRTVMLKNIVNTEQAQSWDGDEGDHWTDHEDGYNAAPARHYRRLLAAARIASGDRVLDVGCGCGESTRDAARAAASGRALGVDLSARMIERARERARAEGLTNVAFEQSDAQVQQFEPGSFDVTISRFGCMFFADPVAAFENIARAVRPGGRLAMLSWQVLENNRWLLNLRAALAIGRTLPGETPGAVGPFGLAEPDAVKRILESAGWKEIRLEEVREPMYFGPNGATAFEMMRGTGLCRGLSQGLDDRQKAQALAALRDTLQAHETAEGVLMDSAAWLITASRA